MNTKSVHAYGTDHAGSPLHPVNITRRTLTPHDVEIVFTTSAAKARDAKRLGADHVVVSTDAVEMSRQSGFDMILDTVSARHDVNSPDAVERLAGTKPDIERHGRPGRQE